MIRAPFTEGQAQVLNERQTRPDLHPYTCPNDGANLIAYPGQGWGCPQCDYTQDWAHNAGLPDKAVNDHCDKGAGQ